MNTLVSKPGEFSVVVVRNPFDVSDRVELKAPAELKSIATLISRVNTPVAVSVNGGVVAEGNYSCTYPMAGDVVVIMPIPQGGDGKNILRIIAMVALTYFTMGMTSGLFGMSLATTQSLIMLGGTMLINALLPPPMPDMGGFNFKDVKDSPTYGIDGAKNTSVQGLPIPLCFGEFRMAGNIIAMHSENVDNTQNLYTLINLGEGEIDGVSEILLNNQSIDLFEDASYRVKTGTANQSAIGWFNKTITPVSVATKLTTEHTIRETTKEVDEIRLDFVCGRGLQKINSSNGNRMDMTVTVEVTAINQAGTRSYFKTLNITDSTGSAVRRSLLLDGLEEDIYTVKVRRSTEESTDQHIIDEVTLADINEIVTEKVRYKHTALLGVKVKLTDQLNGMPNITSLVRGIKCNVWHEDTGTWVVEWTNNPAWISLEMLSNTRFGGRIPYEQIDIPTFKRWAKFCQKNDLTFNGVLDGEMNLWDALQPVMRVGHAKVVMMGTRYSLSIEMIDEATMMFGQANIIKDSFSIEWLSLADRANEVEVSYYDKNDKHKQKTVRLYDDEAIARGEVQRLSSMTLLGVDNEEQAYYEAKLALNINKLIRQTVSFDAHVDSIACRIGDVVYVQHNMPQWGFSGRVLSGSTVSKLIIAEDLSDSDTILIKYSARKRYDATVSVVSGEVVYLSGFDGEQRVRRMKAQGNDIEILEATFSATHGWGVVLPEAPNLVFGDAVELWDSDVMEERNFWVGKNGAVNLSSPLPEVPDFMADFMAGKQSKMKKPFRVISISGDGNFVRTISAIEYNETVYDRDGSFKPTNNYSSLTAIDHSEIAGVDETLISTSGGRDTEIDVRFHNSHSAYYQSLVEYSKNDGKTWKQAGYGANSVKFLASTGDSLLIRVTAMSTIGTLAGKSTAPLYSHTVLGKYAPPADVTGFSFKMALGGVELFWDENVDLDIRGYRIKKGASWGDGTIVNSLVLTTKVFIPITEPKDEMFHIKAIDTTGVKSQNPTSISVAVGAPGVVEGFAVVRNGAQINMVWKRLDDPNVMEYEVREGRSWGESMLVTKRAGNSYVMPTTVTSSRTFWIKARHFTGIESKVASFSTIFEHINQNRNVVYEEDHVAMNWPGLLKNCEKAPDGSSISMTDGVTHAEYHVDVSLFEAFTAHNSLQIDMLGQIVSGETIGSQNYPATDPRANRPFTDSGDMSNVSVDAYIAQQQDGFEKGVYDFELNGSLADMQSSASASSAGVSYAQGRFRNGVVVNQTTQASWVVATDPEFKLQAWHVMTDASTTGALRLWRLQHGAAGETTVDYMVDDGVVLCRWADGAENVAQITLAQGDEVLVVLVQTSTERKLMVGKTDGAYATDSKSGAPIGGLTKIFMAS